MSIEIYKGSSRGVDKYTVSGSGVVQPQVSSAVALGTDTVRVTFDRDMDVYSIGKFWNYAIAESAGGERLHVVGATLVSATQVDLITELQDTINYDLTVIGVLDAFGAPVDQTNNTASFLGVNSSSTYEDAYYYSLAGWYGLPSGLQAEDQGEFFQDALAPVVSNVLPANGAEGASKSVNITFDLEDLPPPNVPAGIDLSEVLIYVGGVLAYRGDLDAFQAPFNGGSSGRTAIATGHSFVVDGTVDYDSFSDVSVRAVARDLAAPYPNTLDRTWSFKVEDYTDPSVDSQFPTGTGVNQETMISFSCKDETTGSGVDPDSINASVDTGSGVENAIVNGVFQSGWNGPSSAITPNAFNGYDVVIDSSLPFPSLASVSVEAYCDDLYANLSPHLVWVFSVLDYQGVLVTAVDPSSGDVGVDEYTNIVVRLEDQDAVVSGSIKIEIDRGSGFEDAFVYADTPQFKSGWAGPSSLVENIGGVYTVTVDPEIPFPLAANIDVRVTAADPSGNPERM